MNVRTMLAGPLLARIYAALVYLASLVLVFGAAVLTVFIWSGRRAAMILALAVAIAVELMMIGNDPRNWWQFLAVPVVFGALTVAGFNSPTGRGGEPTHRVADEVYAAVVYFAGLLAVFM